MFRHYIACLLIVFLTLPGGMLFGAQQDTQVQVAAETDPQAGQDVKKPPPVQNPDQVVRPTETQHVPSTARKILTNFWSDQKAMWTSPIHMNKDDAKWWGAFGVGTLGFIAIDKRMSNGLPNTASQISFSQNVSQIGATYTTLPIAGGLYLYGKLKDDPKARETGVLGAEALLDSFIIVAILKTAAGRERPELEGGRGRFFKGKKGFPSGHAMMTWSFASLISHEYAPSKITPIIAYGLATTVSVSRFTARKHFASDILAGGAMGWFIGRYVFEHHLDPEIHKRYNTGLRSRLTPELFPTFEPSTHTYGVSLAWNP